MKAVSLLFAALTLAAPAVLAADPPKDKDGEHVRFEPFTPEEKTSEGSVTIGGRHIDYQAAVGMLVVHPKGWDDVPRDPYETEKSRQEEEHGGTENPTAEAAMSYVAYFAHGKPGQN